jgi:hypothetical protein
MSKAFQKGKESQCEDERFDRGSRKIGHRERFQAFGLCRLQTLQPEENLDLGLARTLTLGQ